MENCGKIGSKETDSICFQQLSRSETQEPIHFELVPPRQGTLVDYNFGAVQEECLGQVFLLYQYHALVEGFQQLPFSWPRLSICIYRDPRTLHLQLHSHSLKPHLTTNGAFFWESRLRWSSFKVPKPADHGSPDILGGGNFALDCSTIRFVHLGTRSFQEKISWKKKFPPNKLLSTFTTAYVSKLDLVARYYYYLCRLQICTQVETFWYEGSSVGRFQVKNLQCQNRCPATMVSSASVETQL